MHSLPVLFIFLFLFLFLFIHITVRALKGPHAGKNMPPGPRKLPIIGNLHQLSSSNINISLRNFAKRYGPIMCVHIGEVPTVVISSKELAEHVLSTEGLKFAERPNFDAVVSALDVMDGVSFVAPYGESWRETRKVYVTELLSKNRVNSLKCARENEIWDFIEFIFSSSGKPINFSEQIYLMMFKLNHGLIFGKVGERDRDVFISMFKEHASLAVKLLFIDAFPSFSFLQCFLIRKIRSKFEDLEKKILMILDALVNECKAERRATKMSRKSSDERLLIDALLETQERANEEVPMKDGQIINHIREVFAAGSETSSNVLEWAMSELIKNPSVMAKAQAEVRHYLKGKREIDEADIGQLQYLKLIIKETLRLHPPIPLLPRICRENCEILGYQIPENTHILVNTWALARDPNYWINPDEFQPERFENSSVSFRGINFEFIPFGAGRRMCPGITYAMASIEVLLAQLLYHFDWKLASGVKPEELDMTDVSYGVVSKRKNDLHLVASPAQLD